MKAYLGIKDINTAKSENIYDVENVWIKDDYNFETYGDIAVIKVSHKIIAHSFLYNFKKHFLENFLCLKKIKFFSDSDLEIMFFLL